MIGSKEHLAFQVADDAWSLELQKAFGKRAGDVRYTPRGKGEPGTALRTAYDAREAARIAYDRSCGRDERGLPIELEPYDRDGYTSGSDGW